MTEMKLNEAQQAAVTEFDRDLLVSAGAGTGKTRVLVEKFLQLIGAGRAHADEIAAITFTNKAAAEMRERVRNGIRRRSRNAAGAVEKELWAKELVRFEAARIGTRLDS
jgi:ATP-dependent helicase/nuclease subunit A